MANKKGVILGHAPKHFRNEVLKLINWINACDSDCCDCKEEIEKLYNLLSKLWNCTDVMPWTNIETTNEFLQPDEELSRGSTYGMMARKLRPVMKEYI